MSVSSADIRSQREFARADDNFELMLHYDDLKVTLKAGMLVREPGARFTLYGTKGSFVKHGIEPQEEALKGGHPPLEPNWGEEAKEHWGRLNTETSGLHIEGRVETMAGNYPAYYQNIADAVNNRAPLAVKPEEALNTIRIIEAAIQSSAEKRTVRFS